MLMICYNKLIVKLKRKKIKMTEQLGNNVNEDTSAENPYAILMDEPTEQVDARGDDPYAVLGEESDVSNFDPYDFSGTKTSAENNPYAELDNSPEPLSEREFLGLLDIVKAEIDSRVGSGEFDPDVIDGDKRAVSLLSDLLDSDRPSPRDLGKDEDPVSYLKRTIAELGSRVGYSDKIANVGYDGAKYYAANRALKMLNALNTDPDLSRNISLIDGEAALNPAVRDAMFGEMRRLSRDQLEAL